jgi:hypothetical protein
MFEIDTSYTYQMFLGLIAGGVIFVMLFFIVFEALGKFLDRILPR